MTEEEAIKEWKRLDELSKTNFLEYTEELSKPWVGMEADLEMFQGVLFEHQKRTGKPLRMIEDYYMPDDPDESGYIKLPQWHTEAMETFFKAYGENQGRIRFMKASTVFWDQLFPQEQP